MIKPKRIYSVTGKYNFHQSIGTSRGSLTLYDDNRVIGEIEDKDSSAYLRRNVVGIYDPFYDNLELLKIGVSSFAPIFWKLKNMNGSKRSPFPREIKGEYTGNWEIALASSTPHREICWAEPEKLTEINLESLKAFLIYMIL